MKISIKLPQQELLHAYSEELQRWDWEGGRADPPEASTLLADMPLHPGNRFEVVQANMAEEEGVYFWEVELRPIE